MDGIVAPGARVLIRDEGWLVRRVDGSSVGGELLVCDGVSDLVRGRTAQFLTRLEDAVELLHPAQTRLIQDVSSRFNAAMLYIEGVVRRNLSNDDRIRLGHRAVMNLVAYQLDPALQALQQPRQRILIADAIRLGKTLEAGILATVVDDTLPNGLHKKVSTYAAPFALANCEDDCRTAWAVFAGKDAA